MKKIFPLIIIFALLLNAGCQNKNSKNITTNSSGDPLTPSTDISAATSSPGTEIVDAFDKSSAENSSGNTTESSKANSSSNQSINSIISGSIADSTATVSATPTTAPGGKVYYVSFSSGNDENAGTSENSPWKNLRKITAIEFKPGDTIKLKCGDTWEQKVSLRGNGTKEKPITLTSYGTGPKPKISNKFTVISMSNPNGWNVNNLEIECTSEDYLLSGGGTNAGIEVYYQGIPDKVSADLTIENNTIYGKGFDKNTRGIVVYASYPTGKGETARNIKLNKNVVHDVGWAGISVLGWDTIKKTNLNSLTIFNNVQMNGNQIYNVGGLGSYLQCVTNGEIKRNLIYNAGQSKEDIKWGPVGTMTISCDKIDVMFNEIYGMSDSSTGYDGTGIDIDWNSKNVRIMYNYCHDNYGAGIVTMACEDSIISNNRVKGNSSKTTAGRGQIALTDYTADMGQNRMTGVKRLTVSENLMIASVNETAGFSSMIYTPGDSWVDNSFMDNRIVLPGTENKKFINLTGLAKVEVFQNNKYYSDIGFMTVIEFTGKIYKTFEDWKKDGFDTGGLFSDLDNNPPSNVGGLKSSMTGQNVSISWNKANDSDSGLWHYNIHFGNTADFTPTYINMLGEAKTENFVFEKPKAGTYYIKVTAEDNNGQISRIANAFKIVIS